MGCEVSWTEPRKADGPKSPKCRWCRRQLRCIPHSPLEIEPHCESRGCRFCGECFRGETSVSPVRPREAV